MQLALDKVRAWIAGLGDEPGGAPGEELEHSNRRAWRMLGVLLVALLLLAAVFPVESAVMGIGQVSVDSRVKTITHPYGGVLEEVLVREGDRVREGQVLIRLDQSVVGPSARNATMSRDQLLALRARLEAERDDRASIAFPAALRNGTPSARAAMEREQRQFALTRRERGATLALLNQRVRQFREQIRSYRVQIDATQQQLTLIQPELEGLRSLKERGLVTVNRLNQMERTAVQLSAAEASLEADIAQAEARISETNEQILTVDQSRRVQAGVDLATVISQLSQQDSTAAQMGDTLRRSVIVAPQAGVIDNIVYTTVGSAIPANEPIVQIVPDGDRLIVTAQVSPSDVDALVIGQRARVRFSALERQLSPEIEGRLVFVAAERTDDRELGVSYYDVRVEIAERDLTAAAGRNVRAGQPVEVFFTTGRRSILSYAIKPLTDQMRMAMRE